MTDTWTTSGISSRSPMGGHALFFDFDGVTHEEATTALREAQDRWHLGPIALFHSSPGSWHGVCPDKRTRKQAATILSHTPFTDEAHGHIGLKLGRWILRVGPKVPASPGLPEVPAPQMVSVLPPTGRICRPVGQSAAHLAHLRHSALRQMADTANPMLAALADDTGTDGGTFLLVEHYRTTKGPRRVA